MSKDNQFYRFTDDDFISIPAADLRVGDELSWYADSPNSQAGVCRIQKIMKAGKHIIIDFPVTPGMRAVSTDDFQIDIGWEGGKPVIVGTQWLERTHTICIRPRREGE